jgi:hypothetical protein
LKRSFSRQLAESILLAVAVAKIKDEPKVLKASACSGGRGRVAKMVVAGLGASISRTLDAALHVLHYWRDDARTGWRQRLLR